jgi:hypothetical protein
MASKAILAIQIVSDASKAAKEIDSISTKTQRMGKVSSAAGKLFAVGLAAVGVAAVKLGQQASDLAETQSKVNQIFGEKGAAALDKFASSAAKNLGQSKQQALDAAASFGVFGKAAGLQGTKLAAFSSKLTVLASDMASFSNTDPAQAAEALGAALRGESEPIRAYGVMLNEATLKAEAMRLGLLKGVKDKAAIIAAQDRLTIAQRTYNEVVKKSGKDSLPAMRANVALKGAAESLKKATEGTIGPLTTQQKVLAAQSAIMRQTKDAQGDFAKTSDGLANKQRILKASMTDLGTQIGAKVLPAMLALTSAGLASLTWIEKNRTLVIVLVATLAGLLGIVASINLVVRAYTATTAAWAAVTGAATAVQNGFKAASIGTRIQLIALRIQMVAITVATKAWAVALKVATIAQKIFNAAMRANPIGLIITAIALLVAGLVLAYKKSETFRRIVDAVGRAGQKAFGWIVDKISELVGWVKDKAPQAFNAFKTVAVNVGTAILAPFRAVQALIEKILDLIGSIKIPDITPGFDIPGIPLFRSITTAPTTAPPVVVNVAAPNGFIGSDTQLAAVLAPAISRELARTSRRVGA